MDRRSSVLGLLALGAMAGSLPIRVQGQSARAPYRIALLPDFGPVAEPMLKVFIETLRESGRLEGRDYVFYRSGIFYGPNAEIAVRRVVEEKPDLIFAANLGYIVAAHKLTKTIPIVMWISGFPVEGGVAVSLARPGKNVTGMTVYAGAEVFGKLVQLLRDTKPSIKRIGALVTYVPPFHPPAEADAIIGAMRDAGRALGIDLRILEIARPEQTTDALATVVTERMEALLLTGGASTASRRQEIMRFAVEKRLPTISDTRWPNIEPQPLLSYGFIPSALMREAAAYVERILWGGVKPGDLPIQLPTRVELIVNQKTAKAIGITVPPSILQRADQVIE